MSEAATLEAPQVDGDDEKQYGTIYCEAKDVEGQDRLTRFMGTTATRDRDGDEIPLSGWDFKPFKKNSPFLWSHNRDMGLGPRVVLGHVVRIKKETIKGVEGWVFDVKWLKEGTNPDADMARSMVEQGALKAVSVGFRPIKSRWIRPDGDEEEKPRERDSDVIDHERTGLRYEKKELLELSLCPVPCNPEALVVSRSKGMEMPQPVSLWLDAWEKKQKSAKDTSPETGGEAETALTERLDRERSSFLETVKTLVSAAPRDPKPTTPPPPPYTHTAGEPVLETIQRIYGVTTNAHQAIETPPREPHPDELHELKARLQSLEEKFSGFSQPEDIVQRLKAELPALIREAALPGSGVAEKEPDGGSRPHNPPAPAQSKDAGTAEKPRDDVTLTPALVGRVYEITLSPKKGAKHG